MDNEELEQAFKQFKESFSVEDWTNVNPEMFFEYGYLAGMSSMQKEVDILNDAMEDILYEDTISSKINCLVLDARDKISSLKRRPCVAESQN